MRVAITATPHTGLIFAQAAGAGWSIAQRVVGPDRVVVDTPALGQNPDLLHRVEEFAVEQLILKAG